jgi:hypothetical protein
MTVTTKITKSLRSVPISISGEWIENQNYEWKGSAVSIEPFVAVVFLKYSNVIEWCKTSNGATDSESVKLWISRYNKIDLHSQIGLPVGRSDRRSSLFLKSASYKPEIKINTSGKTGEIIQFTEIGGSPKISFEILFIARSDVKFGRNRIWHLRENANVSLSDKVRNLLEKGRIGRFFVEDLV